MIPSLLDELLDRAFEEDLSGGDITTEATVLAEATARATAVARKPLVVCGGEMFVRAFRRIDPDVETKVLIADGTFVEKGASIWQVRGRARSLLMAERTALNFTQRMSGIATAARTYVAAVAPGSRTRITDTRKTTPGLRVLERYAVRTGGAHNHRDNLGSAVMIKDNHIIAAGGIAKAVERARARAPHTSRIEVEVANLAELDQALNAGADIIMLDNFSMDDVRTAVNTVASRAVRPILEVSGGITLERIRELSQVGVDVISVGALTHSAPAADIALDLALD
ncbi:MAG: carboxylating nicotinate-nucleotide diphosphorylase [Polyangiaceae bacterium]|nr:carboxylating nicotinate-nucleotide diphosphorylase [Polyangiaceae bacterium]